MARRNSDDVPRRFLRDDVDRRLVELVLAGESTRAIAKAARLPEGTVKWRLHRLYLRAGVANRTQLVLWLHANPTEVGPTEVGPTEVGTDRNPGPKPRIPPNG